MVCLCGKAWAEQVFNQLKCVLHWHVDDGDLICCELITMRTLRPCTRYFNWRTYSNELHSKPVGVASLTVVRE